MPVGRSFGSSTENLLRGDRQPPSSSSLSLPIPQRRRRARVSFNTVQVDTLETRFKKQRYINNSERQQLAMKLGLSDTQVIDFFIAEMSHHGA